MTPGSTAAAALDSGHLTVVLHGEKLAGGYAFIRTGSTVGREDWLMIKTKDDVDDGPRGTDDASALTGRTNDDYA